MSSFQVIILGFAGLILAGALLLMLPVSARSGSMTPFHEALFTSTSAVCVTGLVVRDTASHWSAFGQAVILILIQIGGLGVVTVAASISLFAGKKISLMQRSTMREALSATKVGGIVRLTRFIVLTTFLIELAGMIAMLPVFCRDFGLLGIWFALFHSVSAFCNAGFDLMGTPGAQFVSLAAYHASPIINITVMLLIIVGGIGFLTWEDIFINKLIFKRYRLQSKVILSTTAVLLIVPSVYLFFCEFADLSLGDRIFQSLFQAVTPRTAGFNTADLSMLTGAGQCIMIILMLIGGSPGSTAGGMKTTTIAVLFINMQAVFCRKSDAQCFGRRIEEEAIRNAATVLLMYLAMFLCGALAISIAEDLQMGMGLFEAASAVGTVGLSLGLTPQLHLFSRSVLILLMFLGRVGGLTFIYAALSRDGKTLSRLPQEKITVG